MDSGIAPLHARLRGRGGRVEIEAVGGPVGLANGEIVPQGHGRRCRLPLEVTIGEARIRLAGEPSAAVPPGAADRALLGRPLFARLLFGAAMLVAVVLGSSFALNRLSRAAPEAPRIAVTPPAAAMIEPADDTVVGAVAEDGFAKRARGELQTKLAAAGLATLTVEAQKGRLVVSGVVPGRQGDAWRGVQAWFDQAYGGRLPLVSRVSAGSADQAPPLMLRAIWFGERPYVIASDGARYHEGAFIAGGWTIKKIGETELLLARNGSTVALKYR
jgi:hypothetical protein